MAVTGPINVAFIDHPHHVEIYVACPGMTRITIQRTFDGSTYPMNWYQGYNPAGGRWQGVDGEPPSGTTRYDFFCKDGTADAAQVISVDHTFDHDGDWFFELGLSPDTGRLLNVESFEVETRKAIGRQVLNVLHRADPIAVTFGRSYPEGELVLITLDDDERQFMQRTLYTGRLLVFIPRMDAHTSSPKYLSIGDVEEERTSKYVHETSRRFKMQVQQVARPPVLQPFIPLTQFTGNKWSDLEAYGTWAQVEALGDEWDDIMDFPFGAED
jgi:hypothetical protein